MNKAFQTIKMLKQSVGTMLGVASLCLVGSVQATDPIFVNDGIFEASLEGPIDATNFVNNGTFSAFTFEPYQTFNTENYTNRGSMSGFGGFDFQTHPNPVGATRMATSFHNTGTLSTGERIIVGATNVLLRSTTSLPAGGLLEISGDTVDASRSVIGMGFEPITEPNEAQTVYWGVGTNQLNPIVLESLAVTPPHLVELTVGGSNSQQLVLFDAASYVSDVTEESNRVVRVAFIQDFSNPEVGNAVYFTDEEIVVEWVWTVDDPLTFETVTNYLYLRDDLGSTTNLAVFPTNGSPRQPVNYRLEAFTEADPGLPGPAGETSPPGVFEQGSISNLYSAWGVEYTANTEPLPPVGNLQNIAGRVEVTAHETLDLKLVRMGLPNYLSIEATNHFEGAQAARILSVFSDFNLATTNGSLTITNLLLPIIPKLVGSIEMYSAQWTTLVDGITNNFHVLFVDSVLDTGTNALVANLHLRSDDAVVISDELNIISNAVIDAQSLTIITNGPGAVATNGGALNFLIPNVVWSSALPSLQYFTNQGTFTAQNAVYFGSAVSPYQSFVNTGTILDEGTLLWTDYLENGGLIFAGSGSVDASFGDAVLSNGTFLVFSGDIRLAGDSLVVGNHDLMAGRELRLDVADVLDDGGPVNDNQWSAGPYGGVKVLKRAATGDLLGTTVSIAVGDVEEAPIVWAGADLGCVPAGFVNNVALKELVLDGGDFSLFTFDGAAPGSALYVETLTLLNYTTNVDGVFPSIEIDPSITVYYALAFAEATDVSSALDGALGGRLCWVSGYAGAFSSVEIVYSATETVVMNAALAASSTIDSDADGIVNSADPTPLYTGSQMNLTLGLTSGSPAKPLMTWATLPGAENIILYKESLAQPAWSTLTNFVVTTNMASVVDEDASGESRLYRVQVNP